MASLFNEKFDAEIFVHGQRYGKYVREDGQHFLFHARLVHKMIDFVAGQLRVRGHTQTLQEILQIYKIFDDEDQLAQCVSFLQLMLRLNPSDRATAKDLVLHKCLEL